MDSNGTLYWIIAAAGILLSGVLFVCLARRRGFPASRAAAGFLAGLGLALLFAKSVYVCFYYASLDQYGFAKWFRAVPKEFSFVAGAVGFCLGPALLLLKQRHRLPALLDCLAAPGCLLAACLRFSEIFLGQLGLSDVYAMGLPDIADGSFLARFPFAVQDAWGVWYLSVSTLAALAALGIGLAAFLRLRKDDIPAGMVFERCAFLLCAVRFFLELTRMECMIFFFVHVEQALCAIMMVVLFVHTGQQLKKTGRRFPVLSLVFFILCIALNGIVQYLQDKPWKFQALFTEDAFRWLNANLRWFGYVLLLSTTVIPIILYLRIWHKAKGNINPVSG